MFGALNSVQAQVIEEEPAKYVIAPTAADLGKYGCIPVSYYTGQADISIPLYSTSQLGVPFQMTLSYDGGGQLLNKLPGWTGHNWTLMAGGVITRVENGQADEWWYDINKNGPLGGSGKFGHFYNRGVTSRYVSWMKEHYKELSYDWTSFGITANALSNEDCGDFWMGDTEPDVFYFSFCGKSGRFFLGDDGEWKVYSEDNIKVVFDIDDKSNYILPFSKYCNDCYTEQSKTIKGFTLIDDNGVKYIFGGDQSSIDYSIPSYGLAYNTKVTTWHASAWHLTKIVDRNDNELYSFQYEHGYFVTHANYGKTKELLYGTTNDKSSFFHLGTPDSGWSFSSDSKDKYNFSFSLPTHLKSIRMLDGTQIDFTSGKAFSTNATAYSKLYDSCYFEKNKPKEINDRNFQQSFFVEDYAAIVGVVDAGKRYFYLNRDHYGHENFDEYRYNNDKSVIDYDPFSATGLKCLNKIEVKEYGKPTKTITLEYNEKAPRMHLTNVRETDSKGKNAQTYTLTYNHYNMLPKDYSLAEYDFWGYYGNYKENTYWVDAQGNLYTTVPLDTIWFYVAGNRVYRCQPKAGVREYENRTFERKCNTLRTQYGSLSEIQYPTGGRAVFEFEQNDYACYRDIMTGDWRVHPCEQNEITGGLRIKSISLYSDATDAHLTNKREFFYEKGGKSTGELSELPHWAIEWNPTNFTSKVSMTAIHNSENALIPLQNSFGPHVGYTRVEERCDGISTIYEYSNFSNTPIDERYQYYFQSNPTPHDRYSEIGFCRGRLLSKTVKDKNGKKMQEQQTVYRDMSSAKNEYTLASHVQTYHAGTSSTAPYYQFHVGGIYKIYYPKYDVASQTEKVFYNNGKDSVVNTTVFNKVDYDGCRLTRSVTQKSNTGKHGTDHATEAKTEYTYAFDYFGKQTATNNPITNWNISELEPKFKASHFYPVISAVQRYNQVCQGTTQTRYMLKDGKIQPSVKYSTLGSDSITNHVRYLEFNNLGLPTRMQQKGMPCSYLYWDGPFIQAIVTAGDTTKVPAYTSLANPLECVQIGGVPAYQVAESQTTVVRYGDDNRIKSITDELGLTQYYEYDGFGRLASVRDKEHRRVASYSYHVQEDGFNYVKTGTLLNAAGTDSLLSIQYYDGLGRPSLTASNAANPEKKFAYALTEYDSFGRESKVWSPVIGATSPDGGMAEDFASKSSSLYNDAYGYAKTEYDALGRVVKTTRPGKDWHTKGKSVNISYGFNGDGEVKKYSVAEVNGKLSSGYYPKGDLQKVITTSEDGDKVAIYKDCRDLTVLERRYNGSESIETYYVYNNLGQLVWVLQPKYQEEESLSKFAFHYEYDGKGRVLKKTIPGCEYVQYWYDNAGRVIKMQDGVLRAAGKFRVYAYDGLGRLKKQSIYNGRVIAHLEIVNYYDDYRYLSKYSSLIPKNNVDDTDLAPLDSLRGHGQLTGVWQRASNGSPLLMSYSYDEYGRLVLTKEIGIDKHLAAMGYSYNFAGDLDYDAGDLYRYDKSAKALNDNSLYSWTKHYFHESNNKLPYRSVIHLIHKGSTKQTNDEIMKSSYDDFGNMIANDRKGTAGDMTYAYDYLHGWLKQIGSASGFSQTLFRENSDTGKRYDGSIAAMSWRVGDNYNRTYHYDYDQVNRLLTAEYSSWQGDWSGAATSELRSLIPMYHNENGDDYSVYYEYDKNTNIKTLSRYGTSNTFPGAEIDALSMAYNGNQLKSVCDNSCENLTYTGAFDFVDNANSSVEYTFNENGAMTQDLNKGIDKIEYDLLGNPQKVTFLNKNRIQYIYAPDGRKLKAIHITAKKSTIGNSVFYSYHRDTTDYINNYVFKNGKPEMYHFNGGYYSFDDNGNMDGCHLYVQDCQGNNRMVVNAYTDEVEQINHYYPYGALMGDISTNPDGQKYKYGGKELDRTYGLDLHDFEARQQDPLVGRFTCIDPMAEKYYEISPYAYCAGDPINYVDLHGDTLTVNGDQSQAAMDQLQAAAGESITLSRDSVGNVTYEQNDPNKKLRGNAKRIARIIDDKNITVKVTASSSNRLPNGAYVVGGAFMGNTVTVTANGQTKVVAAQRINPLMLGLCDTKGTMILHEVTEAYEGALISQKKGISSPPDGVPGSVYPKAHKKASPQLTLYAMRYDLFGQKLGNEAKVPCFVEDVFCQGKLVQKNVNFPRPLFYVPLK